MTKETRITKRDNFDMSLLPVMQNLAAMGLTEADIGMIIGYTGRKPGSLLKKLKEQYPEVRTALELGKKLADTELVTTAFQAATGYDYLEVAKEYRWEDEEDEEGNPTGKRVKVLIKEKETPKHVRSDSKILAMLLISRMPESFIDSKKLIETLPTDLSDSTRDEILKFAGALANTLRAKKIESKDIIDAS